MHIVATPEIASTRMSYETTITMSVGAAICANCGLDSWLITDRFGGDDRLERVAELGEGPLDDAAQQRPARDR